MASYQDSLQSLTSFSPYIQQLPVSQMVEVGLQKQGQYNEGVQRIQSTIDNVAGLDVVRDVDKQYLQSKLDELGGKLKTVAAGDFSNFQLVNSTAGMVGKIAKDKHVLNAVGSTNWYRKQLSEIETNRKEGKSSIQNEWDFSNKANKWLTSTDINEQFTQRYAPYIDVDKKFFDVMKSLHSDLLEEDIPYAKKEDGSIDYTQTAAAMQRVSKEQISAAKIENALRSSLSPDELNQLGINGRFQFKDVNNPENLVSYYKNNTNKVLLENNSTIKNLEGLANLSTSAPQTRANATERINELKQYNNKLTSQLSADIENIRLNPEAAKEQIYKNEAIEQFANANSWEHTKANFMSNPILEAEHWNKNYALDQTRTNLAIRAQNWKEYKDIFDMNMSDKEYELKVAKQNAELNGTSGQFEVYGGQSTNIKDPLIAMQDDVLTLNTDANKSVEGLASQIKLSVGQMEQAIKDYNSGDASKRQAATTIIPVEYRDEVDEIINNRLKAERIENGLVTIKTEVENSPKFKQKSSGIQQEISNSSLPTVSIDYNGNKLTFSKAELAELTSKTSSAAAIASESNVYSGQPYQYEQDFDKPLTQKEKFLLEFINSSDRENKTQLNKTLFQYKSAFKDKIKTLSEEIDNDVKKKISERHGSYIPRSVGIVTQDSKARETWANLTSRLLSKYTGGNMGIEGGAEQMSPSDAETALKWLADTKADKIQYGKLTQGNKQFLTMRLGTEEVTIPMSQAEASSLPMVDAGTPNSEYKEVVEAQLLGGGNTNPSGNFDKAYFNHSYLPNIKTLNVKADLSQNSKNSVVNYITIHLNTPSGQKSLKLDNNPMPRESAIEIIKGLTDEKVKTLFLQDSRIPAEWKEEIKNL